MHIIDLDDSILSIITIHPEAKDILFDIGFKDIIKPGMLQTVGRNHDLKKRIYHEIHRLRYHY